MHSQGSFVVVCCSDTLVHGALSQPVLGYRLLLDDWDGRPREWSDVCGEPRLPRPPLLQLPANTRTQQAAYADRQLGLSYLNH